MRNKRPNMEMFFHDRDEVSQHKGGHILYYYISPDGELLSNGVFVRLDPAAARSMSVVSTPSLN